MTHLGPRPVWNLPTILTLTRIALVPVLAWLLFASRDLPNSVAATAVFLLASVTDLLDGRLARSRGLITPFGELWDPIADKALTGMAFIGLSCVHEIAWWVTIAVVVREIGITAMRIAVVRSGVVPAGRGGKVKTTVQMIALTMALIAPAVAALGHPAMTTSWHDATVAAVVLAAFMTVLTGVDYVVSWRKLVGKLAAG